ncbi:MAG: 50S ribosomal protein L23 [Planctomycetia bacterium]|nr:50S ribosomal protein L23 [Planctomycetia bacterium]RLT15071.1 MAG: 50S ribosomal protein L23 [Planctomycetota bacterium]
MSVPVPPAPHFSPRLTPHQVIIRPMVTEKGMHRANRHNAYTFEVVTEANKTDIRRAIEELFNVEVEKVAVQNRAGKMRRSRTRRTSTKAWKKAIVTLKPDFKINLF